MMHQNRLPKQIMFYLPATSEDRRKDGQFKVCAKGCKVQRLKNNKKKTKVLESVVTNALNLGDKSKKLPKVCLLYTSTKVMHVTTDRKDIYITATSTCLSLTKPLSCSLNAARPSYCFP